MFLGVGEGGKFVINVKEIIVFFGFEVVKRLVVFDS